MSRSRISRFTLLRIFGTLLLAHALLNGHKAFASETSANKSDAQSESQPASPKDEKKVEATPRTASSKANPENVRLGEAFEYAIEITDSSDVRYELPSQLSLGAPFEVIKVDAKRTAVGNETVTSFSIKAALFELGEQTIGDIVLSASSPNGERSFKLAGVKITAQGDLKDGEQEAKLGEMVPPVDVLVPRYTALWIAAGLFAAVVATLLIIRYMRHRPRKAEVVPIVPRLRSDEKALQALQALQNEDLPGNGKTKEFYFRLSEILRDYLGERFGFLALDMTTEELLAKLAKTSTPGLDYARFEAFCVEGDLVKYAKLSVSPGTCKQAMEEAFGLVRSTTDAQFLARSSAQTPKQGVV